MFYNRANAQKTHGALTIRAIAGTGDVDMYVTGEIGWDFTNGDVRDSLASLAVAPDTINLHINSPGGNAFAGVQIYNTLKESPALVNVIVEGMAASAASVIAMAGDTVTMATGSSLMIHDAMSLCYGNAAEKRKDADLLDGVSANLADIYAERAGQDAAHWRDLMLAETWFHGQEAVDVGLATRMAPRKGRTPTGEDALAACAAWDLTVFAHAPKFTPPGVEDTAAPWLRQMFTALKEATE
jgi:ATP-dependent protease ClpP protease subunit